MSGNLSINGYDVPRVKISQDLDLKLKPTGKRCAPPGMPNPPGGLMRSHTAPTIAICAPGSWLAHDTLRSELRHRDNQERMYNTSVLSESLRTGTWSDLTASLRPSTTPTNRYAGGGRTQGALSMRPNTVGSPYDATKHGWHDPRAQAEYARFSEPSDPQSWAWMMRKARDHTGYGEGGMVSWGDVQGSAISGDGPDWFVGPRTVDGPFTTRKVPVRRCPVVSISDNKMRIRAKTFEHGGNLATIEKLHEHNKPSTLAKQERASPVYGQSNKAKYCSLQFGGCDTKPTIYPRSQLLTRDFRAG